MNGGREITGFWQAVVGDGKDSMMKVGRGRNERRERGRVARRERRKRRKGRK